MEYFADKSNFKRIEDESLFTSYQVNLLKTIREEANSVKDCFTKFSFQAVVLVGIAAGFLTNARFDIFTISVACLVVVFVLLTVARIGTYKYSTANRNYGYELHLFRSRYYIPGSRGGWQPYMRNIGWEEALRAWRVVQATIFEHLYFRSRYMPNFKKKIVRDQKKEKLWFEPPALVEKSTTYYSGSYLQNMLLVLHALALLSVTPIICWAVKYGATATTSENIYAISFSIVLVLLVVYRIIITSVRRKILEGGFLCIHSCAIMWQAVVVAHYRALERSNKEEKDDMYKNYTRNLSREVLDLKKSVFDIYKWIHKSTTE